MIIIKHGNNPEPKRWKFICRCGCEWIADETDVVRFHNRDDIRKPRGIMDYHALCYCPDCGRFVEDEQRIDDNEYEDILVQTDTSAPTRYVDQTEEEQK